ncbi:MAG: hypothetical protein CK425_00710 [Parachlamydia sp.]|nr:MAG: hypothetical protein CK425_00710 [Parachlamydia sp.]
MRLSRILCLLLLCLVGFQFSATCEEVPLPAEIPVTSPHTEKRSESTMPLDEVLKEDLLREGEEAEAPFWKNFLYMLFILSFIVGLIFFLTWTMKKMVHTRLLQENIGSSIKILDKRSLSPKSMLYLIEMEGKRVLVGESANGITKLVEKTLSGDFSMEDEETQVSMQKIINAKKENPAA